MRLNTLSPAPGARKDRKRVGRGCGSGLGKTCGRGQKGQRSRSGGYHKVGFEGGQMPLQRRLPKVGFRSRKSLVTEEIRLGELSQVSGDIVTLAALRAAGLIRMSTLFVKIMKSGEINRAMTVQGLRISAGAKAAVEAAGGKIVEE
jgi:large subunit ribosomal protein L15